MLLCGGVGSKLYPLSTPEKPKPFLNLISEHSMLQETALRVQSFRPPVLVCHHTHEMLVIAQLAEAGLTFARIISERVRRNTGPAIAAVVNALANQPEAIILCLPCDHAVLDNQAFKDSIHAGLAPAEEGQIVLFGALPAFPETGYGYIETAPQRLSGAQKIVKFHEKPDDATARTYIQKGFYWNTGMVMGRIDTLTRAFQVHAPDLLRNDVCISFDHAVLEHAENLSLIPTQMGWHDIGHTQRLAEFLQIRTPLRA